MEFNMHQAYVADRVASEAVDVDGATVQQSGPEVGEDDVVPETDVPNTHRDSDGTPVGLADAEADAAR